MYTCERFNVLNRKIQTSVWTTALISRVTFCDLHVTNKHCVERPKDKKILKGKKLCIVWKKWVDRTFYLK